MSTFFLAPALVTLRDEINALFPKRDRATDGWIGDPSHAARVSDHNPCWTCAGRLRGVVRATDTDIGPDGRNDLELRDVLLKATIGDPRVWYVIHNGIIYSRTYGWAARRYTGTNAHHEHVHVSLQGANGISGTLADQLAFDTAPWIGKGAPPATTLPAVYLGMVLRAARYPTRSVHPLNVKRVQRCLAERLRVDLARDGVYGPRTRAAYSTWQRSLGYTGADADGLPGMRSLTLLCSSRYRVMDGVRA